MGVHVILNIEPRCIDDEAWARVHDDTLALLEAWPTRLLGWTVRSIEGTRVPMYARSLRCDEHDLRKAHWSVTGDRDSLQTGECQTLYRDLSHYKRGSDSRPGEDIVLASAAPHREDTGGPARVFGDKTQGHPFHFAVLAAAMLVEERFPQHAMVWGDIDRGQAQEARRIAAPILGRELPLPVRVDAPRLLERLRPRFEGDALPAAFNRVYLDDPSDKHEAMLRVFPGDAGDHEWRRALSTHKSPSSLGALELLIAWLNSGRALRDLCRLACLDPDGPRFSPEQLVDAIAATWIAISRQAREPMDVFRRPLGTSHTIASLFGSFMLDGMAVGRHLRVYIEPAALVDELRVAFGETGAALAERLRDKSTETERVLVANAEMLLGLRDDACKAADDDPERLATVSDPEAMSEVLRLIVQAMGYAVSKQLSNVRGAGPKAAKVLEHLADAQKARCMLAQLLGKRGPTLTEDAWDAILAEQDTQVLAWLVVLASMLSSELHVWQVQRAFFENAKLRRYAIDMGRGPPAIEEFLRT